MSKNPVNKALVAAVERAFNESPDTYAQMSKDLGRERSYVSRLVRQERAAQLTLEEMSRLLAVVGPITSAAGLSQLKTVLWRFILNGAPRQLNEVSSFPPGSPNNDEQVL